MDNKVIKAALYAYTGKGKGITFNCPLRSSFQVPLKKIALPKSESLLEQKRLFWVVRNV